ncbi:MAG: cytochrome b/b6 domain-containing protein [Burkholderiaceae bacterium]|nr:cytochrome b/b6 domain-containing protein [Burkholderiaceae bacterium]
MASYTVRVWDLPTRIFHWTLMLCVIGLVVTAYRRGDAMEWHFRLGYAVVSLLLFRLVWGLLGGRWSRFSSFLYGPRNVIRYLRGQNDPDHLVGHNPMGAASVFALLALLLAQVATGLFSDDEVSSSGPLSRLIGPSLVSQVTYYHKGIGQWVIYALVALHLGAILFHLFVKKDNLIQPMIHGDKVLGRFAQPSRDDAASRSMALVIFACCAGLVAWVVKLAG